MIRPCGQTLIYLKHHERMLLAELGPRGKGRLLELAQLIEQGASVNCKDYRSFTPLYFGKLKVFLVRF